MSVKEMHDGPTHQTDAKEGGHKSELRYHGEVRPIVVEHGVIGKINDGVFVGGAVVNHGGGGTVCRMKQHQDLELEIEKRVQQGPSWEGCGVT
ncbi:hypothetical protein [Vibrio mediterranei]|uniref:hypothetical protein n=1 Tax=Vibrio mediterranei TaxID=689 RepID=UPI00148CBE87|nr:hypothetical protein [Vibrio mediterranei]NOI26858.1 hypothetical protein [Vibrio mediterranei]